MYDIILDNTYLIILLPLWIFLIIMCGRFFSVYVNKHITHILTLISSFAGIIFAALSIINMKEPVFKSFLFLKINNFAIKLGLQIDKLSLIFCLVLFIVSFAVQIFSISYMKDSQKQYRFFALLNLFNFAMSGLIFSPNLFQMYMFWGLVGVVSYLLIGFDYKNNIKSQASRGVFLTNSIGDVAFLGGIVLFSYFVYNYSGNYSFTTLEFDDLNASSIILSAYTSPLQFCIINGLFIVAAFVKSAQIPFYNWLQDAMEAKLPVSALLHSATMVAAGVFLILRLMPLLELEPIMLKIISFVGIITALICSMLASIETHPKKVLAYSTSASLGIMFLAIGLQNVIAAVIFFVSHAFIKSALFLLLPQENKKYSMLSLIVFLVGCLNISGILFSCMVAKELIYGSISSNILSVMYCFAAFFTTLYLFRIAILMIKNIELESIKNINLIEIIPPILLIFLDICLYAFLKFQKIEYKIAEPFFAAILAWFFVYFLYKKDYLEKYTKTPTVLKHFCNVTVAKFYSCIANAFRYVEVYIFENYKLIKFFAKSLVDFVNWIEVNVMNKSLCVVSNLSKMISEGEMKIQTKNVQSYNAYALVVIAITVSFIIMIYTYIIGQMN